MSTFKVGQAPWEQGSSSFPIGQAPWEKPQTSPADSIWNSLAADTNTDKALFPTTGNEGLVEGAAKTVGNVPSSGVSFLKGLFDFFNPVNTAKTVSAIPSSISALGKESANLPQIAAPSGIAASTPASATGVPDIGASAYQNLVPQFLQHLLSAGESAISGGDWRQSIDKARATIQNDPVGQIAPLILLARQGAEAVGKGEQFDHAISTIASPVTGTANYLSGGLVNKVKQTAKFLTSQETGLEPKTLETVYNEPNSVSEAQKNGLNRGTLGQDLKNTIDERIASLSDVGKGYEPIRASEGKVMLPPDWFTKILEDHEIGIDGDGKILTSKESTVLSPTDVSALQSFYDTYASPEHTPNSYLNTREALTQLSKYDAAKTGNLQSIARDARGELNRFRNQIPGLENLDAAYAPEVKELKAIKKEWINQETGELKDNALTQIANAANEARGGENTAINQKLSRLEAVQPGITHQIRILKAIEDIERSSGIKVGTYARGGTIAGSAITGFFTGGPIGALVLPIVTAILTAPEVAVPLIKGMGYTAETVRPVLQILRTISSDVNNLRVPAPVQKYLEKPKVGLALEDVNPEFKGFNDITTKVLDRLKGKTVTSKQEILDLTNMPELKQAERDLIRKTVGDYGDKVPVKEFADKVKTELLPLKRSMSVGEGYESISLPDELRGPVTNYSEHLYESPIKTSAGDVHYSGHTDAGGLKGYFAHTRIEDLPVLDSELKRQVDKGIVSYRNAPPSAEPTRRVIELQSDLFQKGRLEGELKKYEADAAEMGGGVYKPAEKALEEAKKLEPYRNTWHERVIREEVKQAAKDGKTKLQFPTGETAMKIERLGERTTWLHDNPGGLDRVLKPEEIKVGLPVSGNGGAWIITDVLGDGKFKAITKNDFARYAERVNVDAKTGKSRNLSTDQLIEYMKDSQANETFDISGKVDTQNPIYRFYEKEVGKYLLNKYGAKRITDPQGVEWWEVKIDPKMKKDPIGAFSMKKSDEAIA